MISMIKNYLKYRKNKKIVKREMAIIGASLLPIISNASILSKDIILFISKLSKETKNVDGEILVKMVLDEVSDLLNTDSNRIIEILTYIASLSPNDIQKLLVHSMVETMPEADE